MAEPISSNSSFVAGLVSPFQTGFMAEGLCGVDDDNTLAESGVFNSHHMLQSAGNTTLGALRSDASNVSAAAVSYDLADLSAAANYR